MKTAFIASVPMLVTAIHVFAGINIVAPPCTSLTLSPKLTFARPFCKKRISSDPGCLWRTIFPPGGKSSVPKTKCDEPPFCGSTFNMKRPGCPSNPSSGLQTRLSPSFFSRMSGATLLALVVGSFVAAGELAPLTAATTQTAKARWIILTDASLAEAEFGWCLFYYVV